MITVYRNSETGRIVDAEYAKANPATTEKEVIRERFSRGDLKRILTIVDIHAARRKELGMNIDYKTLLEKIKIVLADTPK
jgi:hypothetical protein